MAVFDAFVRFLAAAAPNSGASSARRWVTSGSRTCGSLGAKGNAVREHVNHVVVQAVEASDALEQRIASAALGGVWAACRKPRDDNVSNERYIEVSQSGQTSRIPIVTASLLAELPSVEPSGGHAPGEYRPCQVELMDGTQRDPVYVVEAVSHLSHWGFYPKNSTALYDIKHIRPSPTRLSASLANKLYRLGETNMGGFSFGLVLKDGRTIWAVTGDAVDFLEYPEGVSASDVGDVIHGWEGWQQTPVRNAPFLWCLYCLDSEATQAVAEALPALNSGLSQRLWTHRQGSNDHR